MNLRKFTIVPMLAMALFAVGCGPDCESLCEDGKECKGADKDTDCAGNCEKIESLNEKAGCEDQYDDAVSCAGDQDDICKADADACSSEQKAYVECLTKYCVDHASDCEDVAG